MHLGDAPIVAADEAEEDLGEEAPLRLAEASHDAEVDRDDVAGLVDEEVSLVHVGVEEAVAERMAEERLHQPLAQAPAGRGRRPGAPRRRKA